MKIDNHVQFKFCTPFNSIVDFFPKPVFYDIVRLTRTEFLKENWNSDNFYTKTFYVLKILSAKQFRSPVAVVIAFKPVS